MSGSDNCTDLLSVSTVWSMGRSVPMRSVFHGRMSVVDNLVGDLGLRELEDQHRSAKHQREKTQRQGLPGLQGNESEGQGHQSGSLELQTKKERDHDLLDKTTTWKRREKLVTQILIRLLNFGN